MNRIYLATPYTHPDESIREHRFMRVCKVAGYLMQQGHMVYSPISHSHPIAVVSDLPLDWEYWEEYDRTFMKKWATHLYVYMANEWEISNGVMAEIEMAEEYGLPVVYLDVEV